MRIAQQMQEEFTGAFRLIASTPGIGHKREDLAGERQILFWPVRDYLVIYQRDSDLVEVITVMHGRRDVPRRIDDLH